MATPAQALAQARRHRLHAGAANQAPFGQSASEQFSPGEHPKPERMSAHHHIAAAEHGDHGGHVPANILNWRGKQARGAIMKPSTFARIEKKSAEAGYDNPKAVAGRAYWNAVYGKYNKASGNNRQQNPFGHQGNFRTPTGKA